MPADPDPNPLAVNVNPMPRLVARKALPLAADEILASLIGPHGAGRSFVERLGRTHEVNPSVGGPKRIFGGGGPGIPCCGVPATSRRERDQQEPTHDGGDGRGLRNASMRRGTGTHPAAPS